MRSHLGPWAVCFPGEAGFTFFFLIGLQRVKLAQLGCVSPLPGPALHPVGLQAGSNPHFPYASTNTSPYPRALTPLMSTLCSPWGHTPYPGWTLPTACPCPLHLHPLPAEDRRGLQKLLGELRLDPPRTSSPGAGTLRLPLKCFSQQRSFLDFSIIYFMLATLDSLGESGLGCQKEMPPGIRGRQVLRWRALEKEGCVAGALQTV